MDDLREVRAEGDLVQAFNRNVRTLRASSRIVEAGELSLATGAATTVFSTAAAQPGRLVFIQPASADAMAAQAFVDADGGVGIGFFSITHGLTALDAEARFRYFIT